MPILRYEDRSLERREGESILDTLLRHGVSTPHSCRAGVCGSCLMRATDGSVPARAQAGLKDSWKALGYFLACVCTPEGDMAAAPAGGDAKVAATVSGLDRLSPDVLRVELRCDIPLDYRAGQYITLIRGDGLARSYSIASLPEDGKIELHVRRIPKGRMSGWLFESAPAGERVDLLGPSGECFYVAGNEDQPILLAGAGTGLAPLYGILRDAIRQGHRGPIHLFHGAVRSSGLYLRDELAALARQVENLEYTPTVLEGGGADSVTVGAIDQTVMARYPKLNGWRAYVCGDPGLVQSLRMKLFLGGVALRDIHADAFLPSAG